MTGDATSRATLRTFIALDLPDPLLDALATTQEQVQHELRGQSRALGAALRWSPTKNLHLTLRFLGDTTAAQQATITTHLHEVATHIVPFTLEVDVSGRGLGAFPNLRQPRVIWSGVTGDLAALHELQAQVEAVAQVAGFVPETKAFSPHLTLARAARDAERRVLAQAGAAIHAYAEQTTTTAVMRFQVDRVVFYQSELGAGGSRYTVLAALPLTSTAAPGP